MGRKLPKEENNIEILIDVIREYDQSEYGVEALSEFALTGVKPPMLSDQQNRSVSTGEVSTTPAGNQVEGPLASKGRGAGGNRSPLYGSGNSTANDFDHSLRSTYNNSSMSWSASHSAVVQLFKLTPSRQRPDQKMKKPIR